MKKKKYNVPEILDKILKTAMSIYEQHEDLGKTLFIFSDDIYEVPLQHVDSSLSDLFRQKPIYGLAIAAKFEISEKELDKDLKKIDMPETVGMPAIAVVYKGTDGKEYMHYTFILKHKPEEKFKFSRIRRVSSDQGFKMISELFDKIFVELREKKDDNRN